MARQGNYVTIPGVDPNWAKGISSALSDLSNTYNKRAADERAEAERLAAAEESRRRFDLQEARAQAVADRNAVLAGREDKEYETQQAMTDWYKQFGDTYNPDDIRKEKAKSIFNVTDEQLNSDVGRQILDAVPLYQEDVANYYGSAFTKQFGKALDPTTIAGNYSNLSSLASLQAAENERAKALGKAAEFVIGKQIDIAKKAMDVGKSSTSSKAPASYNDIITSDLAKKYQDNSWFNPLDSYKQDAKTVADNLLEQYQKEEVPPAQAKRAVEKALDILTTGSGLDKIDSSADQVAVASKAALEGIRAIDAGTKYDTTKAQKLFDDVLSGNFITAATPKDVRATKRAEAKQVIDQLLNRTIKAAEKAGKPVANTGNVEKDILNTTGIGPKGQVTVDTPAATPRYAPSGTSFMGNQGINTVARADLDGIVVDPNVMVNSPTAARKDWLINTIPEKLNRVLLPKGETQYNQELWEGDGNVWARPDPVPYTPVSALSPEVQVQNQRLATATAANQEAAQLNKAAATLIQNMPADRLQVLLEKGNLKPELKDRILRLLEAR